MTTLISYHPGAYGPTLLIAPFLREELETLERLFFDLAARKIEQRELSRALACELDSLEGITLLGTATDRNAGFRRVGDPASLPRFEWHSSPDAWTDCALLVRRLRESDAPGHQYLTREGVDDALVVVSFGEVTQEPARGVPEEGGGGEP